MGWCATWSMPAEKKWMNLRIGASDGWGGSAVSVQRMVAVWNVSGKIILVSGGLSKSKDGIVNWWRLSKGYSKGCSGEACAVKQHGQALCQCCQARRSTRRKPLQQQLFPVPMSPNPQSRPHIPAPPTLPPLIPKTSHHPSPHLPT